MPDKSWLLRRYEAFKGIPAVFIDGALLTSWSMLTALLGVFSGEEAYKYCNPHVLFWSKAVLVFTTAGLASLKAFRSTSYSQHQENKKIASGNTEVFTETKTKEP
jgi:hypothetical protein